MKLLQLNIWEGKLTRAVLPFLDKEKPDILCLQEVFSCDAKVPVPRNLFDALQCIQERTGYEYCFFSPLLSGVFAGQKADFGQAILSRYPLSDQHALFTNGKYNPDFTVGTYDRMEAILQTCTVHAGGKTFSLANHHGHWLIDPMGDEVSVEKMALVKAQLEKLPQPLIFAGDLNVKCESPAMRVFDGFLTNLIAKHNITSTLGPLGKVPDVACDHILVSDDVDVHDFRVSEDIISDHKALLMEFDV
jgi:endonuclease/exonuclease/phosphatase family metal-dependent hydrolase